MTGLTQIAWRHRFKLAGALVLLAALAFIWVSGGPPSDARLEAVRRHGYPVTLTELDAWYPAVPDAENAALIYTNAFAHIADVPNTSAAYGGIRALASRSRGLWISNRQELAEAIATNAAALRLLHSVPPAARSRYPVDFRGGVMTVLPHLQGTKQGVSLLTGEAMLRASEGDAEQATRALLAAGTLAESLAEEPSTISRLVHVANWEIILPRLQRVLDRTPLTEAHLVQLQELVERAEHPQSLARSLAAERACGIALFTENFGGGNRRAHNSFGANLEATFYRGTGLLRRDENYFLDAILTNLEAAEQSYPARWSACARAAVMCTNVPSRFWIISYHLLPALAGRSITRDAEHTARVRAAATALAVERFRRAHANNLPARLDDLVPTWIKTVPADPFDGRPLHYKTRGASFAVYSVGTDGVDNGGVNWDQPGLAVPTDIAFVVLH